MAKNILAFSGSLRKNSMNTGLIRAAIGLSGENMTITLEDISKLPLYNQDMEVNFPKEIKELKDRIRAADGVIIASPEFNRSISGALKNMLDWTSRPYGDNAWAGKVVATMGAGGQIGTALSQYHLKQILLYLDAKPLGQPEFHLSNAGDKFDQAGNLIDEETKKYITRLLNSFGDIIKG